MKLCVHLREKKFFQNFDNFGQSKFLRKFSNFPFSRFFLFFGLLEHIFKKMGSTEIVVSSVRPSVRPSVRLSVRPSVSYFSAAIAPRVLKFST
jgi:hypothetical protein